MRYCVTGATGFIDNRLVEALQARRGGTCLPVRPGREDELAELRLLGRGRSRTCRSPAT